MPCERCAEPGRVFGLREDDNAHLPDHGHIDASAECRKPVHVSATRTEADDRTMRRQSSGQCDARLIGAPGAVSGEMFTPRIPRLGSPGTRLSERTARTATALTSVFAGTTTWALTPCPKLSRCLEAGLTSIFLLDPSRTRARVGWEPRQQRSVQTRGPRKVACGLGLCERDATRGPAVAGAGATARMLTQQAPNVRRAAMLSCHLACPALKVVIVPQ